MEDLLTDTLETVPAPAMLLECDSLRFVASNVLTAKLADQLFGTDTQASEERVRMREQHGAAEPLLERIGVDPDVLRGLGAAPITLRCKIGWVTAGRLPAGNELPRPDLMLLTLAQDDGESLLVHSRAAAVLRVNEIAMQTIETLENAAMQMQAAIRTQRQLLADTNAQVARMTRDTPQAPGA